MDGDKEVGVLVWREGQMMVMQVPCHACGKMGESRMCITDIPYFKEVVIMSFVCDFCGFRTNEVSVVPFPHVQIKCGGSIPKQGQRLIRSSWATARSRRSASSTASSWRS